MELAYFVVGLSVAFVAAFLSFRTDTYTKEVDDEGRFMAFTAVTLFAATVGVFWPLALVVAIAARLSMGRVS